MKVGQRLFLAVLPAVLGVIAVAALAYWGQYARTAPLAVVVVGGIATTGSLWMAWYNTRYVARRVRDLAERTTPDSKRDGGSAGTARSLSVGTGSTDADELDAIETTVHQLSGAVSRARDEGALREQTATARAAEYAAIAADIVSVMGARLEEAELPLHVLLSSPFGSLNENQEEMLAAAQAAVGAADEEVRRLRSLLDLDRGAVQPMPQAVGLEEMLRPALAIIEARARAAHVDFRVRVSCTAPRVIADPVQTQTALTTILSDAVSRTPAGAEVGVEAVEWQTGTIRIVITHREAAQRPVASLGARVSQRLVALQRGSIIEEADCTTVDLPSESLVTVRDPPETALDSGMESASVG